MLQRIRVEAYFVAQNNLHIVNSLDAFRGSRVVKNDEPGQVRFEYRNIEIRESHRCVIEKDRLH